LNIPGSPGTQADLAHTTESNTSYTSYEAHLILSTLSLSTGGQFFIICRRRPQTAGMIPPNDVS
jgi:hypothetical protein